MKTTLTAASFASMALLLASCSNEDNVVMNDSLVNPDEIRFEAFANGMTRAENVFCNNNLPSSFTVYAQSAEGVYINGDAVSKNADGVWKSSLTRYWPEGEVTFWGIVNGDFAWGAEGAAPTIENFSVAESAAEQKDLLYARATGTKADGAVKMNFRHALSQICFKAKNTSENINVTLKGIEVVNVYSGGTYTFPTVNTNTNLKHPDASADVTDGSRGTWAATGRATYGITFDEVALTGDAVNLTPNKKDAENNELEYSASALLMIPGDVNLVAWDKIVAPNASTGTYFLLDVVITSKPQKDGEKSAKLYEGKIAVAADFSTWAEGMKYIYTFDFKNDGNGGKTPDGDPVLYEITFDVTVDEFIPVDEAGKEINI